MSQPVDLAKNKPLFTKIRDEGRRVAEIATEYDVSTKTTYGWLKQGGGRR
jgi:transposase